MAMNTQGGGPWGGGGGGGGGGGSGGGGSSRPQPPDIEELLRRGQEKFKRLLPGGVGGGKRIALLALVVVAIWLASGFYRVQPGQQGVELLFGKFVKMTSPGLNYWLPGPIGDVLRPDVQKINEISVGFRSVGAGTRNVTSRDVPLESLMLTGDQNIIDIDFVVQWRIKSASDYLFNIRDPDATIKLASESAIREIVGQTNLEDTLSKKRTEVEDRTRAVLQDILDSYGSGVFIDQVKLQTVEPPSQVIDAFNDVQRARQDKERQQNEAVAYRNDIVPKAKGQAQKMVLDASAERQRLIKEAEGEAKAFISVYEAYKTNKNVTRKRLFLERMQQVLGSTDKVIIDQSRGGTGVLPFLPLPELQKRATRAGGS